MHPFRGTSRYEVIRVVGKGGMGVVYEVLDQERNLRLALKTLPTMNPAALYLFKQEFRALADISHPNLVALDELSSEAETWFFTMEYVEGVDFVTYTRPDTAPANQATEDQPTRTVFQTVTMRGGVAEVGSPGARSSSMSAAGPCDYKRLRSVLFQLVEGLCALHDAGKLHRDIKPSNLIVSPAGRCVLLDFGLVFDLASSQSDLQTPQVAGTYAYMAPEQASGGIIGEASDWYAVGVTLFQALTGVLPFHGTAKEILSQKMERDPPLASTLQKDVPEDLNHLCRDLLQLDSSRRPAGREVLRLLSPSTATGLPPARRTKAKTTQVFVGRAAQLADLRRAMSAVAEQRAVIADVHGVSGAGKSVLVQRFLDEVSPREGTVVLSGRCYEQESVPYKAVDSLIDALSGYLRGLPPGQVGDLLPVQVASLARIFPVLGWLATQVSPASKEINLDPVEIRRQAFLCLREIFSRIAAHNRLILYIDDLQWGDRDSAALLSEILRPPDEPPVLLIGVSRSEYAESSPCLQELRSSAMRDGLRHVDIPVMALAPEEALLMAKTVLEIRGRSDPQLAEEIVRESHGNAYFLRELLEDSDYTRGLRQEPVAGAARSLDEVIWERLQTLPENARRLLEIVAVSGKPLAKADAYQAAGFSQEDPILLSALRAGHFVRSAGPKRLDDVESFHDRVRETVLQRLPAEALRELHACLGSTFESTGRADPERLATHFDAARNAEKARHYYPLAAERASTSLAFDHAVWLYRRALELEPAAGSADRTLRIHFADALANSGRGVEAARVYEQLAHQGEPDTVLDLQQKAAYQYCVGGLVEEGRAVFAEVIEQVGLPKPRGRVHVLSSLVFQRTRLLLRGLRFQERPAHQVPAALLNRLDAALALAAGLSIVEVIDAIYFSTYSVHLALQAGEPVRLVRALALQAAAVSASGQSGRTQAERMLGICRELTDRVTTPEARATVVMCDGLTAFNLGEWTRGRRSLAEAEMLLRKECAGVAWELATSRNMLLQTLCHIGEHREISERVAHLKNEVQERGDLYSATWIACHVEPMSLLAADRPGDARHTIEESLAAWKQKGYHQQHYLGDVTQANILLYQGEAGNAVDRIQKAWPMMRRSLMLAHGPSRVYALDVLARSMLMAAVGERDRRQSLVQADKIVRRMERGGWYEVGTAWATAARACIASLQDQPEQALRLGKQAAERFSSLDMSLYAAAARRQTGLRVGGQEGKEQIRDAEAEMRRLGVASPERMAEMLMPGFATSD
jgi:eukaryotic-like serine/threonine-protein kinase